MSWKKTAIVMLLLGAMPCAVEAKAPGQKTKALVQCIEENGAAGNYTYFDGGKSARELLRKECAQQYFAYVNSCARGTAREHCYQQAEVLAQRALKALGK